MTATITAGRPNPIDAFRARIPKPIAVGSITLIAILIVAVSRAISNADDLTSSYSFGTAMRLGVPIGLAALGGLFAERSGTVNIGLEGMMILGTITAGYAGWHFGPWAALVAGFLGGAIGGLLHALATTTFGVDHIISGVAINIIAPGVARFLANEWFTTSKAAALGGSVSSGPAVDGRLPKFTVPFSSGGDFFGWKTPDPLRWFEDKNWFLVSDVAGILKGMTSNLQMDTVIAAALFFVVAYFVWRTPFGLRLRSCGEKPSAADSLGVNVVLTKYIALAISGGFAGLGGAVLVLGGANRYQENMTQGIGYLGLAALIVGNWRPAAIAVAAVVFGYSQATAGSVALRAPENVHGLLLMATIVFVAATVYSAVTRRWITLAVVGITGVLAWWAYVVAEEVNNQFAYITPYVVTVIVVTVLSQRLRPPANGSQIWRKGQAT